MATELPKEIVECSLISSLNQYRHQDVNEQEQKSTLQKLAKVIFRNSSPPAPLKTLKRQKLDSVRHKEQGK